jgi:hypothetical protein
MIHQIVGAWGAAPPTEGKPSVLPNIIFGLIKPSYLFQANCISSKLLEAIVSNHSDRQFNDSKN